MTRNQLVLIEWLDSARPSPEWEWLSDIDEGEAVRCASVGWLLHDGEVKTLAPNIGDTGSEAMQASGVIRIPTCSITRMQRLLESEP